MDGKVQISVIVPTHNRKDLLLRLLESLLRQSIAPERYEVIVVCDGVTDGTDEEVQALCRTHSQLRLMAQPQSGPAAARNAGARLAQGSYLAFTDDDCVASGEWLEKLVQSLQQPGVVGVWGQTTTIASQVTPLTHQMVTYDSSIFVMATCNAACRRDAFEQLGGFEEAFPFPHNEDADFAWRLESLGRVCYAPSAVVVHPPRPETFTSKALWVRYFESEFLLFARNPNPYRKYRSPSPWVTIYWQVFVINQFRYAKSGLRDVVFRFRPDYYALTIALIFARSWNLIRFFPRFLRASRALNRVVRQKQLSAPGQAMAHGIKTK